MKINNGEIVEAIDPRIIYYYGDRVQVWEVNKTHVTVVLEKERNWLLLEKVTMKQFKSMYRKI